MICGNDIPLFPQKKRIWLQAKEFLCLYPHASLQRYISSYNITFPTQKIMPTGFTVLPSGCATLAVYKNAANIMIDLHGPVTKPYFAREDISSLEMMVTIEFKPAGLFGLTGIAQSEIVDKTFPLDAIDPFLHMAILETVEKATSIHELVADLDMLLLENMQSTYHPELKRILHVIQNSACAVSVKDLSRDICYSERQLNRIFTHNIGTSVKAYVRVVRINNTFDLLHKPHASLRLIADVTGYHDLSHFLRDFKLLCGITPNDYLSNMSAFYTNTKRF